MGIAGRNLTVIRAERYIEIELKCKVTFGSIPYKTTKIIWCLFLVSQVSFSLQLLLILLLFICILLFLSRDPFFREVLIMFSVHKLWLSIMSCCLGLYVLKFFLPLLEGFQIIEKYDFFFTAAGFLITYEVLLLVVDLTIWYGPNQWESKCFWLWVLLPY